MKVPWDVTMTIHIITFAGESMSHVRETRVYAKTASEAVQIAETEIEAWSMRVHAHFFFQVHQLLLTRSPLPGA